MNRAIGIYIHVPFCKSRCKYCDFYSTTLLDLREQYVEALLKEIEQVRSGQLAYPPLGGWGGSTIYFGGGTPSLLEVGQIETILTALRNPLLTSPEGEEQVEITLEANPGDLTLEKLQALHAIGINRLSMGIQSFQDELLRTIGRRHTAAQAIEAVQMARQAGFDNLSIDLMYGLPGQTEAQWHADIEQALALRPEHISCYCLSYEEGTVLTRMLEQGEIEEVDDDTANRMYDYLCEQLKAHGYKHYEVSNFALPSRHSRHNSSYWNNTPYIGLGAGAHSYDGTRRYWNIGDIRAYIAAMNGNGDKAAICEAELLTDEDRHTEAVMLGLRTSDGIDKNLVDSHKVQAFLAQGLLREKKGHYIATRQGLHILNRIIEDLI